MLAGPWQDSGWDVGCRQPVSTLMSGLVPPASSSSRERGLHGGPALPTERVCHADEAGRALGVSALFAYPCEMEAGPPVGLSAGEEALPQDAGPRPDGCRWSARVLCVCTAS